MLLLYYVGLNVRNSHWTTLLCWHFNDGYCMRHEHGSYCIFLSRPLNVTQQPPLTRNKITRLVWRPASKTAFLDFIPVSSSRCPFLFYIQILGKHLGCLINKTVRPQYSLWCLPPGISMSQLPAPMVCRYLNCDGYISSGSLYLLCTTTPLLFFKSWQNILFRLAVMSNMPE